MKCLWLLLLLLPKCSGYLFRAVEQPLGPLPVFLRGLVSSQQRRRRRTTTTTMRAAAVLRGERGLQGRARRQHRGYTQAHTSARSDGVRCSVKSEERLGPARSRPKSTAEPDTPPAPLRESEQHSTRVRRILQKGNQGAADHKPSAEFHHASKNKIKGEMGVKGGRGGGGGGGY